MPQWGFNIIKSTAADLPAAITPKLKINMAIWFKTTIKYQKQEESGKVSNITEHYLVDAMSFTEAEARLYFELGSTIRDFRLTSISKFNLQDLFHYDDQDTWFKTKVVYVSVDEKSGKEKKVSNIILVSAADVKQAYDRITESLSTMLVPFEITDVNKTSITEILPYIEEDERPEQFKEVIKQREALKAAASGADDIERIYG
jgi:hypothetical protein